MPSNQQRKNITGAPAAGQGAIYHISSRIRQGIIKKPKYFIQVRDDIEPGIDVKVFDDGSCGTYVTARTLKEAYKMQDEAIKQLEKLIKVKMAIWAKQ